MRGPRRTLRPPADIDETSNKMLRRTPDAAMISGVQIAHASIQLVELAREVLVAA